MKPSTYHGTAAFLQQAYRNNWDRYLRSLQSDRRGWDLCVLTASDGRQAAVYRRQLEWRREARLLPARTRFEVIADPDGQRIGSGGATLRALAGFAGLPGQRMLLIHSGGDSRRLPHASATGKLFVRVPRELPDGRASTLFDEFLISLSGLVDHLPAGTLVASGDVLLVFDHLQLSFQRRGVVGVAAAAPAEMGLRHGVYVSAEDDHRVRAYLHKPSENELVRWQAVHSDGTVQIDTGLIWLGQEMRSSLSELAVDRRLAGLSLNLYGDLVLPLAQSTTLPAYLADTSDGPATPAVQAARRVIWERTRGIELSVERLQPAVFEHFGTSREYWQMVADNPDLARMCGWAERAASSGGGGQDRVVLINAVLEGGVLAGSEALVAVDSHLAGCVSWDGAGLIAGVHAHGPVELGRDVVLHQLPAGGGFVTRVFGLFDDPKRVRTDPESGFLNQSWSVWLAGAGVGPAVVWPGVPEAEQCLWNARLFPLAQTAEDSLALALQLQSPNRFDETGRARWLANPRLSLAGSFAAAEDERLLAGLAAVEDQVAFRRFAAAVEAEQPALESARLLGAGGPALKPRVALAEEWLEHADPPLQWRGYRAVAEASGEARWQALAFASLAAAIRSAGTRRSSREGLRPGRQDQAVRVAAAARIDFGGGWTDTPPHSLERGGTVLNAAVEFRGQHPIAVEGQWLAEPVLVLESGDLGQTMRIMKAGEVLGFADPADPFALLKAAVVLHGIVPEGSDPDQPLEGLLPGGHGLRLRTQTNIPRGSGLGTSSIMGGAVLCCLARMAGQDLPESELFDDVMALEQMLTTGGGWQDQVGGLVGGIKLITTRPGLPQKIDVERLSLAPSVEAELANRLTLVYTGQQRLAKDLLQPVMSRWMARDPEMVWIMSEIARLALSMRDALKTGYIDGFGQLLSEHWSLNKRMDPGCTNPFIDELFAAMDPWICGGKLAGAGGGGFAIVVTKDGGATQRLAAMLERSYSGASVAVWPSAVPGRGLAG